MSDTVLEMARAERDAINVDRIRLIERVAELEKENEKLRAALDNDGFRCDGCDIVEKAKEALRGSEKLKQRLAEAERERDAAVHELKLEEDCENCKHRNECKYDGFGYKKCSECGECPCSKCDGGESQYEWRGVCEDNSK